MIRWFEKRRDHLIDQLDSCANLTMDDSPYEYESDQEPGMKLKYDASRRLNLFKRIKVEADPELNWRISTFR